MSVDRPKLPALDCASSISVPHGACIEQHFCELHPRHAGDHECECGKEWTDDEADSIIEQASE